eukprot:747863-Hanusia_phi.AAC.2
MLVEDRHRGELKFQRSLYLAAVPAVVALFMIAGLYRGTGQVLVDPSLLEQVANDASECSKFSGFLLDQCLEQKKNSQQSAQIWTEDEMKNGLWKTEKALADMEIRQYKNSKEREAAHQAQNQRLDKFKKRMEDALTLIHQIQDEMGTSHSELVQRLKADIELTKSKISGYIDDGTTQLKEKLDVLNKRETALTKRLLEMVDAQTQILTQQANENHQDEMKKNNEVKAFVEGVHDEQQREDARILSEITLIKTAIETLRGRQKRDYQTLDDMHKKMEASMADNVKEAQTKLGQHVSAIKENVTSQIKLDKSSMEAKIKELTETSHGTVNKLDEKSKSLVSNMRARLSSHQQYQVWNESCT